MPHEVGFVDNSVKLAHYALIDKLHDLAIANGWTALRDARSGSNPEIILQGPGNLDYQDVYVGFRAYQDAGADYYNITVAGFTGYLASETFANQPGAMLSGVPAHNVRVDYWIVVDDLHIKFGLKVGTPVYEHGYAGLLLTHATPGQFPYPLVCAGMLTAEAATRFSDVTHDMPYRGSRPSMRLRFVDGAWLQPACWPWNNVYFTSTAQVRDSEGQYALHPVVVNTPEDGVLGELIGVFFITGFGAAVEDTLVIGGVTYVVMQAVARTGFADYYAMRLDT